MLPPIFEVVNGATLLPVIAYAVVAYVRAVR